MSRPDHRNLQSGENDLGALNRVKYDRTMIAQSLNEHLKRDHDSSNFAIVGPHQDHPYRKAPELPWKTDPGIHIWQSASSTTWMQGNKPTDHYIEELYAVQTPFGPDSGSRINRILINNIVYPKKRPKWGDLDRDIHHPPRLIIPGDYEEMSHVDLRSCYYNIIRIVGVYPELNYSRRVFGVWDRIDDWYPFADNKIVRNSMYGMVFQPTMLHINSKGRKVIRPEREKKISNPALHQLVMIIVNDIGRFAEKLGSPYWHTDGGLIPQIRAQEFYDYVCSTWGLPIRTTVSEGNASVYGLGRWYYEDHPCRTSTIPDKPKRKFEEAFEGIDWLKRRMHYWVLVRGDPTVTYEEIERVKVDNGQQQQTA